jgi:hypothetical protein
MVRIKFIVGANNDASLAKIGSKFFAIKNQAMALFNRETSEPSA